MKSANPTKKNLKTSGKASCYTSRAKLEANKAQCISIQSSLNNVNEDLIEELEALQSKPRAHCYMRSGRVEKGDSRPTQVCLGGMTSTCLLKIYLWTRPYTPEQPPAPFRTQEQEVAFLSTRHRFHCRGQ